MVIKYYLFYHEELCIFLNLIFYDFIIRENILLLINKINKFILIMM